MGFMNDTIYNLTDRLKSIDWKEHVNKLNETYLNHTNFISKIINKSLINNIKKGITFQMRM